MSESLKINSLYRHKYDKNQVIRILSDKMAKNPVMIERMIKFAMVGYDRRRVIHMSHINFQWTYVEN